MKGDGIRRETAFNLDAGIAVNVAAAVAAGERGESSEGQ